MTRSPLAFMVAGLYFTLLFVRDWRESGTGEEVLGSVLEADKHGEISKRVGTDDGSRFSELRTQNPELRTQNFIWRSDASLSRTVSRGASH